MVQMLDPQPGESIDDPTCGTGGMRGSEASASLRPDRQQIDHQPRKDRIPLQTGGGLDPPALLTTLERAPQLHRLLLGDQQPAEAGAVALGRRPSSDAAP